MLGETTYNWDDIQVGRFDLNHSENFFERKHKKHEKFSEDFCEFEAMAALNINDTFPNDIAFECKDDKENIRPDNSNKQSTNNDCLLPPAKDQEIKKEKSTNENLVPAKSTPSPTPSNSKRRPANLLTKFKTPTTSKTNNVKPTTSKVEPPHAYEFKDIYKKKKEELMKKLLEEEKKNRIFHSRPVPKTRAAPTKQQKNSCDHFLTVPKTPLVLKNSQEALEKRRLKMEELKRQNAAQKFTCRKPLVLHEEPFKPKKTTQPLIAPQPFDLALERRLGERKQYDEQNRIVAEERKKQKEEELKKREEELVKELRKLASFKARPNPFK